MDGYLISKFAVTKPTGESWLWLFKYVHKLQCHCKG